MERVEAPRVEAPEIVRQAIGRIKEERSGEDKGRDLWRRAKALLQNKVRASELHSPGGIRGMLGRRKLIPVLRETFGEGEESVEVEISPRAPGKPHAPYESDLDKAAFRIRVGGFFYWLPCRGISVHSRDRLPESATLDQLEELMTVIEEKRSTEAIDSGH